MVGFGHMFFQLGGSEIIQFVWKVWKVALQPPRFSCGHNWSMLKGMRGLHILEQLSPCETYETFTGVKPAPWQMLGEIGVPQKIFPGFCLDVCWCFHPKNYRCPTVLCGYGFLQSLWTPCLKRWTAINFQLFWCENSGIPLVFPPLPSMHAKNIWFS